MMVLRVILKGVLQVYFRLISSLMKSQSNFGKLAIKYKIELSLSLLFTSGYIIFGAFPILCIAGLKEREKLKSLY